jgi:cytochrome c
MRVRTLFLLAAAVAATTLALSTGARGDAAADRALADAVKRGQELWTKPFAAGGKACAACHGAGPNKMTRERLKAYPKWDKFSNKVVSGQQKINAMISDKSKGTPLELGSDDLNALEAFVSTLR